jgi:hypothetical protein
MMESMFSELNHLKWIEELLPDEVIPQRMHEGIGYYLNEKLVLILVESSRTRLHKGIEYPFEIWNGCFFPVEKIKQSAVFLKFMFLENHPALKETLYLPADTEEFEDKIKAVMREIKKRNPLFGVFIKIKKPSGGTEERELDTSRPRLFSEEPVPIKKNPIPKVKKKIKADKKLENHFLLSITKKKKL